MKSSKSLNPLYWIGIVACKCGLHDWAITDIVYITKHKPWRVTHVDYVRCCLRCDKEQLLARTDKYHPTRYGALYDWRSEAKEAMP